MLYTVGMYTVRQLARIAGVTPRTLRYYDAIGLLKPTRVGDNGYRYYGPEALLRLQQILLYRAVDLPLDEIGRLMGQADFDPLAALEKHRRALQDRAARLQGLVKTVEMTIAYLKGEIEMSPRQLFAPISDEQQAEYEKEVAQQYDPQVVKDSQRRWKSYTQADKQRIGEEGNAIYADLVDAIPLGPAAPQVQACIERWRQHMSYFWTPNDEQLLGLADLYNEDPRFKANYDQVDPRLAEFMREAVRVYVHNRRQA